MMAGTLPLRIITPEKITWEGDVSSLVVPAYEGQMGIMPGHAPLLAQLAAGTISIRKDAGEDLLAVSGGFVEVNEGRVSIFAETAELAGDIDAQRAQLAVDNARSNLKSKGVDPEAMAALERALVRLKVAELAHIVKSSKKKS